MIIGFTGTRRGFTIPQIVAFSNHVESLDITEFHHGDCKGADAEAHDTIRKIHPKAKIVIHPPINEKNRAFKQGDLVLKSKEYMARNCDIVNSVSMMLCVTKMLSEEQRSGTWHAIRYTRTKGKPYTIFRPDGKIIVSL